MANSEKMVHVVLVGGPYDGQVKWLELDQLMSLGRLCIGDQEQQKPYKDDKGFWVLPEDKLSVRRAVYAPKNRIEIRHWYFQGYEWI